MEKELLKKTFRNTGGATVYIFLISQVIRNGDKIFGTQDNIFAPFVFLLLFSLSAAVVGGLVFGQSVLLFLDAQRKESITAAFYSVGWLGFFTLVGLVSLFLIK